MKTSPARFSRMSPIYYPPAIAHDRVYVGSADGCVYALAARTGRFLWSYRVAPEDRLIPVYGNLISTWPVAGGVVVQEGSVYAAAGIAHYDGTHVVRLDAFTGEPLAINRDSGVLAPEVNGGSDAWIEKLPALAVTGGTAIDAQGRIYVVTENGQLLCYAPAESNKQYE